MSIPRWRRRMHRTGSSSMRAGTLDLNRASKHTSMASSNVWRGSPACELTSALLEGRDIAASLREAATGAGVDLVVMTTHGRGALGRFWLGSVADRVGGALSVALFLGRPPGVGAGVC